MGLVGHCTLNEYAAAGSAATENNTNNMLAMPNFLLPMRHPSLPPAAAISLIRAVATLVDQAHAAAIFKNSTSVYPKTQSRKQMRATLIQAAPGVPPNCAAPRAPVNREFQCVACALLEVLAFPMH